MPPGGVAPFVFLIRFYCLCLAANILQEHDLAKVGVEGSNPFARSKAFKGLAPQVTCGAKP
jgi:hypothetical protein